MVLVGGQGTRLRPLTLSAPKPMLPTAGVPFLEHLLSRIQAVGIEHVVLGTSYKAETFTEYFGDGSAFGLDIEYLVEDEPLGTGGAIRNVAPALRADTVMVFNGDILSGVDLGEAAGHPHEQRRRRHAAPGEGAGPAGVRVACRPTPTAGCRRSWRRPTTRRPTRSTPAATSSSAAVLEAIPAGRVVSVERETFPGLLASGARVFGHVDSSYWLDLGTPAAFVQGSADLVTGIAPTAALPGPTGAGAWCCPARTSPPTRGSWAAAARSAADVVVGAGAVVDGAVVFDGAVIGAGAQVTRSVIGGDARIGDGAVVTDAVIGDGAVVGDRCELIDGMRVWPGVELPEGGVRFSADS